MSGIASPAVLHAYLSSYKIIRTLAYATTTTIATKAPLLRGLNARHIRFIALGSAIGTGLFYGSAAAIKAAGPAVLLAYLIGGAAVFIVMRALGEMAVRNPVSGSFGSYARQYLGPLAGFITGWTYTFEMVIVARRMSPRLVSIWGSGTPMYRAGFGY